MLMLEYHNLTMTNIREKTTRIGGAKFRPDWKPPSHCLVFAKFLRKYLSACETAKLLKAPKTHADLGHYICPPNITG